MARRRRGPRVGSPAGWPGCGWSDLGGREVARAPMVTGSVTRTAPLGSGGNDRVGGLATACPSSEPESPRRSLRESARAERLLAEVSAYGLAVLARYRIALPALAGIVSTNGGRSSGPRCLRLSSVSIFDCGSPCTPGGAKQGSARRAALADPRRGRHSLAATECASSWSTTLTDRRDADHGLSGTQRGGSRGRPSVPQRRRMSSLTLVTPATPRVTSTARAIIA